MRTFSLFMWFVLAVALGSARVATAIETDELLRSLRPAADVNDYAGILPPAVEKSLEARCRQLRDRTGAQLAVVTVDSLKGGDIDDFGNKLFKQWGIGEKGKNNGLLLLVAMADRKARIEVGYGLEPIVPDVLAGRIIDNDLRPKFREQRYAQGLEAAVNKLCELVEKGEPANRTTQHVARLSDPDPLFMLLFTSMFVVFGALAVGWTTASKEPMTAVFGCVWGGGFMIISMLIALGGLGWLGPAIQVPLGVGFIWLGRRLATSNVLRDVAKKFPKSVPTRDWTQSTRSGEEWSSGGGGWTSGGSGGFSGSWGGFGGGSSGGGGASGRW